MKAEFSDTATHDKLQHFFCSSDNYAHKYDVGWLETIIVIIFVVLTVSMLTKEIQAVPTGAMPDGTGSNRASGKLAMR